MKSLKVLFKTEMMLTIRQFDTVFFGVFFPVGIILLMGFIYGSKPASAEASYTMLQLSFGGVVAVGMCATGLMGIPLTLADYRQKKILKRFKVTPTSPIKLLVAQGLTQFLIAIISAVLVFLVAKFAFNFSIVGSVTKFILAYLLVLVSLYSMGMLLGSLAPNMKVANTLCTLIYFPMLFLSGATIPYEIMPRGLQMVSDVFPLTQGIKLLKGIVIGMPEGDFIFQFILMISITILCLLISLKYFKWE